MFRIQYRHDVNKVERFRDEDSYPRQYTILCLANWLRYSQVSTAIGRTIRVLFERFDLFLTHQLFMFIDPLASSPPSHPRLPRASLISTLYCLRHFLFPSRITFLTYWEILRGKILWIFTVLNLAQGTKRRIEKGSNLNKQRYQNDGFIILTYPL